MITGMVGQTISGIPGQTITEMVGQRCPEYSPDWKKFGQPDSGNGSGGTIFGLPRFERCSFIARFPFATISLDDDEMPVKADITGWSPFTLNDADNSSLPSGALEYKLTNKSDQTLDAIFSYSSKNFWGLIIRKGKSDQSPKDPYYKNCQPPKSLS